MRATLSQDSNPATAAGQWPHTDLALSFTLSLTKSQSA